MSKKTSNGLHQTERSQNVRPERRIRNVWMRCMQRHNLRVLVQRCACPLWMNHTVQISICSIRQFSNATYRVLKPRFTNTMYIKGIWLNIAGLRSRDRLQFNLIHPNYSRDYTKLTEIHWITFIPYALRNRFLLYKICAYIGYVEYIKKIVKIFCRECTIYDATMFAFIYIVIRVFVWTLLIAAITRVLICIFVYILSGIGTRNVVKTLSPFFSL